MTHDAPPRGRRFAFNVELEVNRRLVFSAGDLAELLGDGMISLDHAGLMFPGVSIPKAGDRLLNVSVMVTGFARDDASAAVDARYAELMAGKRPRRVDPIVDQLQKVMAGLRLATLRQRMLMARLMAME